MIRIRKLFKSNKFILLFSMAMTFITISILNVTDVAPDFYLETIILPVLSILWGPFATLGFVIMEGIYLLVYEHNSLINILQIIGIYLLSDIVLWKSWYSIMNRNGYEIPNFNSLYNIIKFFVVILIYLAIIYVLLYELIKGNYDAGYLYNNLVVIFPLTILIMLIGIHISVKYKIPPYTPKIKFRQILPEKAYTIIPIAIIIIGGVNNLWVYHNIYSTALGCLIIILMLIFIAKPLDENSTIKEEISINLFNKINLSLIILLLIMVLLSTLPIILLIPDLVTSEDIISNTSYLIQQFLTLILIPVLIYMYYLERNMTKPINRLSKSLSRKITNKEDFQKLKEDLNSITVNNELKSLAGSLLVMEEDLNLYRNQLIEVTSQKERFETEMKLAHEIQDSMIPKNFEEYNDGNECEIWGLMEPAREVAGDFYDFFKIDDDNIGFVIGDVSGKGITAALIMVKAMTLIQDYAIHYEDPSDVFYEVNNNLCEGNVENLFVTCWFGKINFKTKKLSYVNAGHNPPLIKQNDNFEYYPIDSGVVLAIMEDMPYETNEIQLKSGDSIVIYTDGITEANYDYKDFYGEERLKDIINKHKNDDLEKIINAVKNDMDDFCENQEQFDDTTMFAIRLK